MDQVRTTNLRPKELRAEVGQLEEEKKQLTEKIAKLRSTVAEEPGMIVPTAGTDICYRILSRANSRIYEGSSVPGTHAIVVPNVANYNRATCNTSRLFVVRRLALKHKVRDGAKVFNTNLTNIPDLTHFTNLARSTKLSRFITPLALEDPPVSPRFTPTFFSSTSNG